MSTSGHATAKVNGTTIAETDSYEFVEGNVYFPPQSIRKELCTSSDLHTNCPWKGVANYYNIEVDGTKLDNAAWYYPTPLKAAENIRDHVAFYKTKVTVTTS